MDFVVASSTFWKTRFAIRCAAIFSVASVIFLQKLDVQELVKNGADVGLPHRCAHKSKH